MAKSSIDYGYAGVLRRLPGLVMMIQWDCIACLLMIIMMDQTVRRIERVFARFGNCRRNQIIQSIVTMEGSMQAGTDA